MDLTTVGNIGPEKFRQTFEACFGEKLEFNNVPPHAIVAKNNYGWTVFEKFGRIVFSHLSAIYPSVRNSGHAIEGWEMMIDYWTNEGFDEVHFVTKRENVGPQIIALKTGFLISGVNIGRNSEIVWKKYLKKKENP